ncbi:hypothetical protein SISSUDRAFT_1046642 [Sistotremastrum suecicum HHB10207 ss-3]|uniref:Uncharacterized protein n=1 Tax=Sistotremastrum suecicum HHB10207 ss-3 TaxID=1314776 RepID=A0A166DKW8_9AGAM|nr:hypothetical protein SISSUDRAFT_1046642 [Sistotremastrum suecicum HHB10207 ss-3]
MEQGLAFGEDHHQLVPTAGHKEFTLGTLHPQRWTPDVSVIHRGVHDGAIDVEVFVVVVVLHPQPVGSKRFARGSVHTTSGHAIAMTTCSNLASNAKSMRFVDSNIESQMNFLRNLNSSNNMIIYGSEAPHGQALLDLVSGEGKHPIESV